MSLTSSSRVLRCSSEAIDLAPAPGSADTGGFSSLHGASCSRITSDHRQDQGRSAGSTNEHSWNSPTTLQRSFRPAGGRPMVFADRRSGSDQPFPVHLAVEARAAARIGSPGAVTSNGSGLRRLRPRGQHPLLNPITARLERGMCDNDSMDDIVEYQLKSGELSRRQFGALTLGAGLLSLLPPVAERRGSDRVRGDHQDARTAPAMRTSCIPRRAPRQPCWYGRTSSACGPRSGRWAGASPSRAIRCSR